MNPLRDYRNFSRGGGELPADDRSAKAIVAKVLEDRSKGHAITDSQVLSAHPELANELRQELSIADQIRQAMLAARRTTASLETLSSLTDSEFDASLAASENHAAEEVPRSDEDLPRIPGYLLIREINRGGQAAVYQAIQESTQRKVAIKVMSGGPFASSRHRVRFEREARILASLDHPNIVSIIERGRTPDGSFFFVMPYIDGMPVDEHWKTQSARNPEGLRELVRLFSKIAGAMEEAHSRGIIHRDLKPSNILVDHRGEPHILDFGLARPVDEGFELTARSITVSGQIIGSLPWASPEQAAGRSMELDAVSDVYSIGVILFQALTGSLPYSLDGPIDQVLLRIRTLRAEAPSRHPQARPGVDRSLDAIVLKSLAKLPRNRYPSAGNLLLDLEAWIAGRPIQAPSIRPRRRRVLIAIAAVIISCALASAVVWNSARAPWSTVYQLPALQNSIGMKFVQIPSDAFSMGSPSNEPGRNHDESQKRVVIDHAFYIATTVTTQEQYERVMHTNPSDPRWLGPNLPVQNVSWNQAEDFCHRLGKIDHAHYRLPTEAEWEYACRARGTGAFPDLHHPEATTFSLQNSGGAIHPVAQKLPNAWGLFDMQGNVWQWCGDLYSRDVDNPSAMASSASRRVIRGGSALSELLQCRAASRNSASETFRQPDLGFRVVLDQ